METKQTRVLVAWCSHVARSEQRMLATRVAATYTHIAQNARSLCALCVLDACDVLGLWQVSHVGEQKGKHSPHIAPWVRRHQAVLAVAEGLERICQQLQAAKEASSAMSGAVRWGTRAHKATRQHTERASNTPASTCSAQ